ncbi:MAG TPA: hypothetical protein VGS22_24920 [Thermoanaerobaculia bacterium]|jgi:hypothetical protein|nr:hypothetical protein [Thermoanaerobaculia bacterium]
MAKPPKPSEPPSFSKVRAALWGLAALGVPLLFKVWRPDFPQNEESEIRVKTILALIVVALLVIREISPALRNNKAGLALSLAAILATVGYLNFGSFHGRSFIHHWEQFHYALGAKYFPELGYDGLYDASIEAQRSRDPGVTLHPSYRDLRTNKVVATDAPDALAQRKAVVARFSPERWQDFVADHDYFVGHNDPGYLASIRLDHGFNPPPSWTFVARLFAGWPKLDGETLSAFATLDLLLLAALFVVVSRTYGTRWGCLALALFGINYAGRYFWVGGAFLREDWLAATVIGICLLEKKRYRWAGACFAYAAAVRIFPILFLFGPAVVAVRALIRRERPRWALDFAVGFVVAIGIAWGAGSLAGRGPGAWGEFAEHISQHSHTWLTNNVGLADTVLYDGPTFRRELVDFSLPEPWILWQAKMDAVAKARRPLLWIAQALLLFGVGATAWRMEPARAAMVGIVVVFALVLTTCYYWQMLLIVPLLRSRVLLYATLAVNLGLYALHFATPSFEMRYGMMSWGLLVVFLAFLVPEGWRTLARRTE